jgi:hypothetical protein
MEEINGITILNRENEDYHSHTITYSDGLNSIDEMVIHAGKLVEDIGCEILAKKRVKR